MGNKETTYLKYAYIGVVGLQLVSVILSLESLMHLAKPLLAPILLVYLRKGTTGVLTPSFMLAVLALLFSFVGDSFMMYADKSQLYFLLGIAGFGLAQLFYSISFSKAVFKEKPALNPVLKILYAIPFVVLGIGVAWMIWSGIPIDLKWPISIYTLFITWMVLQSVYRQGRSTQESVKQVILGAVFFVLSDVLLALDKFHSPMESAEIFVMIPYVIAQWNIVNGLQVHYNSKV